MDRRNFIAAIVALLISLLAGVPLLFWGISQDNLIGVVCGVVMILFLPLILYFPFFSLIKAVHERCVQPKEEVGLPRHARQLNPKEEEYLQKRMAFYA